MVGLFRGALGRDITRSRAFERHLQAALDSECPGCFGTLHVWRSRIEGFRGCPSLHQEVVCLHCNLRYTRVLMVPQRNVVLQTLGGLALLVFMGLRVPVARVVQACARTGR